MYSTQTGASSSGICSVFSKQIYEYWFESRMILKFLKSLAGLSLTILMIDVQILRK